jgi:hypothetical protein
MAAPLLVLVGCTSTSSGTPEPSSPTQSAPAADDSSDTTWNGLSAPLGQAATFDSGLVVRVAAPVRVQASSTMVGADPRQINLSFVVTVSNGQGRAFDAAQLTASATTGTAGASCATIRDKAGGLWTPKPASIAAGSTGKVTIGYSCPGQAGQALVVQITPQPGFASAQFTGTLP